MATSPPKTATPKKAVKKKAARGRRRAHSAPSEISPSMKKGRLVELIVESMHSVPGVKVERNQRLPTLSNPQRKSEIDVLITGSVAGYPIRIVVECKNYGRVIHAPDINSFVGKLQDVGVPTQCGIYVTTRSFSAGAIDRAKAVGIRTQILTGLAQDRMAAAVKTAIQSTVVLLPVATEWRISNSVKEPAVEDLMSFRDASGLIVGYMPDLLYAEWAEGRIPPKVGKHLVSLSLPPGWRHVFSGEEHAPASIQWDVTVTAAVVDLGGSVAQHGLVDASSSALEKLLIHAKFTRPSTPTPRPVLWFDTEESLADHLSKRVAGFVTTLRLLAPRIRFGPLYWPLSARVAGALRAMEEELKSGMTPEKVLRERFERLEGESLDALWEAPTPRKVAEKGGQG